MALDDGLLDLSMPCFVSHCSSRREGADPGRLADSDQWLSAIVIGCGAHFDVYHLL